MRRIEASRRGFLAGTAAVLSLGALVPAVFAQDQSNEPKNKEFRFGIIGVGHRGANAHLPAIKGFEEMQILGVCDVMETHLKKAMDRVGSEATAYTDYQKLLGNPDINAVMIATPNMFHSEMVIAALQAGKHVVCEKPMAVNYDQCKAMKEAEEKTDRVVLYTMQLRYSAHYQELRKQIEAGKIGKPKHMTYVEHRGDWYRDAWKYPDAKIGKPVNWRFSQTASGGTLSEKVCHYFDILHWMAGGLPKQISCNGGIAVYKDGRDTWDHAATTLLYENDLMASHDLCMYAPQRHDFQVIGDEGAITVLDNSLLFQKGNQKEEIALPAEVKHGEPGEETAVNRMYKDFMACVREKKRPWMNAEKAMASAKTALLGELSASRAAVVSWDAIS